MIHQLCYYARDQIQFKKQALDNDNNIINNFLEKLSISLQTKTEFPLAISFFVLQQMILTTFFNAISKVQMRQWYASCPHTIHIAC